MLIVNKDFTSGFLQNENIHIFNIKNSYLVTGIWKAKHMPDDSINESTGALFIWRVDSLLNNISKDTVLYNYMTEGYQELNNSLMISPNAGYCLITQKASKIYKRTDFGNSGYMVRDMQSGGIYVESSPPNSNLNILPYSNNIPSLGNYYIPKPLYITPLKTENNTPLDSAVKRLNKIVYFNIDKLNNLKWVDDFKTDTLSISLNAILNGCTLVSDDGVHIIYPVTDKKKNFIAHKIITHANEVKELNEIIWKTSYFFVLNAAVQLDDRSVVFPAIKGARLTFTRMNFKQ